MDFKQIQNDFNEMVDSMHINIREIRTFKRRIASLAKFIGVDYYYLLYAILEIRKWDKINEKEEKRRSDPIPYEEDLVAQWFYEKEYIRALLKVIPLRRAGFDAEPSYAWYGMYIEKRPNPRIKPNDRSIVEWMEKRGAWKKPERKVNNG